MKDKNKVDAILPSKASDDPEVFLRKDKKLYSVLLIVVGVLMLAAWVLTTIFGFIANVGTGLTSLFIGAITVVISYLLFYLLINFLQNHSRKTAAIVRMSNEMVGYDMDGTSEAENVDTDTIAEDVEEVIDEVNQEIDDMLN